MGAVELREAVRVTREMRRGPVENDADAGLVAAIHKFHKFSRASEAAGCGVIPESLVAPGTIVGMLHDGEEFNVRVAEIFHIRNEMVAEFAVVEPAVVIFRNAAPGAKMHFVDGDG